MVEKYFTLDSVQRERFAALPALYADWNSKINVISRKDMDAFEEHHVLHSLAVAMFMSEKGLIPAAGGRKMKVIDVGTGGGFPGIPLAIMFPDVEFTLCDSIGKKIKVVSAVIESLGLENAHPVLGRCESLDTKYDYVVSRAVTDLGSFMSLVKNLYVKGVICLKGGSVIEEISDCVRRCKLPHSAFAVYDIHKVFDEDYFSGKYILEFTSKHK